MGNISVKHIGKAYKTYPTRFSRLREWINPGKVQHIEKWILTDISFDVSAGESIGIIGINGAGKSTLLKMITGTTHPTVGQIAISGRMAALLELGMGFHPDFTGRQNVYMAGQLLGLTSKQLTDIMPEIEQFAEIGEYIDEPVRIYSSGMQVRLAFSIATAVRPDILIVDEALSVGDSYFQHKSFARIKQFNQQGTTLLIVSHDKQAIINLCNRAILLADGKIKMAGDPEQVMDYYNAMLADPHGGAIEQLLLETGQTQTLSGSKEATVTGVTILNEIGKPIDIVGVGQRVKLKIVAKIHKDIPKLVFGYSIRDRLGQIIYGTNTQLENKILFNLTAGNDVNFYAEFNMNLGVGSYSIQTALTSSDTHLENNYEWRDLALLFNVINIDKANFVGCAWLHPKIEITR